MRANLNHRIVAIDDAAAHHARRIRWDRLDSSLAGIVNRLTYKRSNHDHLHVHGFEEEGTTTTPFDMAVLNRLDRFHLAIDVIDRVPA